MELLEIVKSIAGIVPSLILLPKEKREQKDAALRAIVIALDETAIYYRDIGASKARDLTREAQLAKYWSAAAIPMRQAPREAPRGSGLAITQLPLAQAGGRGSPTCVIARPDPQGF